MRAGPQAPFARAELGAIERQRVALDEAYSIRKMCK